jgi:Flp pilus assembly protein TadD
VDRPGCRHSGPAESRPELAERHFAKAFELGPGSASCLNAMCAIQTRKNDPAAAVVYFEWARSQLRKSKREARKRKAGGAGD